MQKLPFAFVVSGLMVTLALGAFWTPAVQADSERKFTLEVAMGDQPSGINLPNVIDPPDFNFPNDAPGARGTLVLASGNIFPKGTLREARAPSIQRTQMVRSGLGGANLFRSGRMTLMLVLA